MGTHRRNIPAVVMGLSATGLASARSLGRKGIEVIGVSAYDDPPSAHSRLFRYRRGPFLRRDRDGALTFYLQLAEELGERAVVLPTGDVAVHFLAELRAQLEPGFRFLVPPREELERITSKRAFAELARERGLPVPRTVVPRDPEELVRVAEELRFPCVVKPESTELWRTAAAREAGLGREKALPVEDPWALLETYERVAAVDDRLLVQELVQGPDENHLDYHVLIDGDGRLRAEFAGRKLRLAPPYYGMGTYVESVGLGDVAEVGRMVLDRIGYRGMGNLNLKRDERDGKLYLFELNPRFSVWTGLDIACGIDLPYYYYLSCIGEEYDVPSSYRVRRRWLDFQKDRLSMRTYARDGTWSWPRWLLSLARASAWSLFAFDDPMPSWVSFRRWVRYRALRPKRSRTVSAQVLGLSVAAALELEPVQVALTSQPW